MNKTAVEGTMEASNFPEKVLHPDVSDVQPQEIQTTNRSGIYDPIKSFETYNKPTITSDRYKNLKVLGMVADDTACGNYRVIHPFWYLNKYGAQCKWVQVCSIDEMMAADVIIAQRQYDKHVADNMIYEALRYGKKVIYEVDDNLHAVLPSSPVFGIYHYGSEPLRMVGNIMSMSTGVTVSTHELAGDYCTYNPNMEVLPNSIDFDIRDWKTVPEDKDPNWLVVGWSGGTTHWEDMQILRPIIPKILEKYDHVKFGIYTSEQMMRMLVEEWELDPERVLFIPPRPFEDYPTGLAYFDIGLAPTINCRFNAAKSNLKILEYGAWGIPCVASKIPPYVTTIRNGKNGFNAITYDNIAYLIENESERKQMGDTMKTIVEEDFNMDRNIHLWPKAWEKILMRDQAGTSHREYPILWGKIGRNDPCPCGSGRKYKKCECYPAWGG